MLKLAGMCSVPWNLVKQKTLQTLDAEYIVLVMTANNTFPCSCSEVSSGHRVYLAAVGQLLLAPIGTIVHLTKHMHIETETSLHVML